MLIILWESEKKDMSVQFDIWFQFHYFILSFVSLSVLTEVDPTSSSEIMFFP